ncbi:hypothetical protein QEG98_00315 [Myxococcus sp. MxC21-1]|uniref:hypothetical protein n=1 Tax=Myxococcus sp. MxC21-1 TaxID=3041439 RepID=UPI00292E3F69|nr:hypothetical protein [Myxococcus sp. MxC21-1]WNZ62343.1 hypothetical protein QEG98_00315 [Myxococcus sp. MxC21-1]
MVIPACAVEPFTITGNTLPRFRSTHTEALAAQTLGTPVAPQDSGAVQVPHARNPPHPSGTVPQSLPSRPQV